jgi:hypothetical protein
MGHQQPRSGTTTRLLCDLVVQLFNLRSDAHVHFLQRTSANSHARDNDAIALWNRIRTALVDYRNAFSLSV